MRVVSAVRLGDSSGFAGRALQAAEDAASRRQRPLWTKPDPGRIHWYCGNRQVEELDQLLGDEVQAAAWCIMFRDRAVKRTGPTDTLGSEAVFSIQCSIGRGDGVSRVLCFTGGIRPCAEPDLHQPGGTCSLASRRQRKS